MEHANHQLDDLLIAWESGGNLSGSLSLDELCPNWSEGQVELGRRIELLKNFDRMFGLNNKWKTDEGELAPAIPNFQIRGELGRGGMGVVYRAWQQALEREVAIKVMRRDARVSSDQAARFELEGRMLARLKHENIVPIYHAEVHQGQPYFVMELVRGGSLADSFERFDQDPRASVELIVWVARAVQYAHEQGVLHRDLKPANILLDEAGRPRVSDFGLAKLLLSNVENSGNGAERSFATSAALSTVQGLRIGTPAYMSPEQWSGASGAVTSQTDVWSLGVILYELLTGRRPFEALGYSECMRAVCEQQPPRLRTLRPALDPALEAIVLRCLNKEPSHRYAAAGDLAADLQRWMDDEPVHAFPEGWHGRVRRWACRHVASAVCLGLALVFGIVWAVAAYLHNPERVRETIERGLAAGRPVTLIRENGPPAHFQWASGAGVTKTSVESDRPFFVSTHETALLELWREPPQAFRFQAEVRHDDNPGNGRIGLFLAYRRPNQSTPWPCCYVFNFTDRGPNALASRGPGGANGSRARLAFHYFLPRPGLDPLEATHTLNDKYSIVPAPPNPGPGPWRTLCADIRPEDVTLYWKNEEHKFDVAVWMRQSQLKNEFSMLSCLESSMAAYAINSLADGSLGLYVQGSSASFRNVILEPLASLVSLP